MPVEVEFQESGGVKVAGQSFDSVEAYADSGVANGDVLGALRTANAASIAERKALVGSSSHHMQRGAAANFHYDQVGERGTDEAQAWADAVPIAQATGLPESAAPAPETFYNDPTSSRAGYAATTGTGPESVKAQIEASDSQRVYDEVVGGGTPTNPAQAEADAANTRDQRAEEMGSGPYESRSYRELQAVAKDRDIPAGGSKEDLIARIRGEVPEGVPNATTSPDAA